MCQVMFYILALYLHAKLLQSCPESVLPMDWSPPGFSVHGILQARILEWVAIPSPEDLPKPGIKPASLTSPVLTVGFFTTSATKVFHAGVIAVNKTK